MEKPIELIFGSINEGGLQVNPEALEKIKNFSKPFVAVSIVGKYRTGKSFLLNLMQGRTDGFPLGSTLESKTKGIWMWIGDFPGKKRLFYVNEKIVV